MRRTKSGRLIFDNDFDPYLVTAEIDGSQHLDPSSWISDAFKQNVVSLEGQSGDSHPEPRAAPGP